MKKNLDSIKPTKGNVVVTAPKMKFSIKMSSVNATKSAVSCGFGHIYLRNL